MTFVRDTRSRVLNSAFRMPSWITQGRIEAVEGEAFLSGAALNQLHMVLSRSDIPQALLRERLVLRAAEACISFAGRPERTAELRDAVHLMRPGDLPGPAGETYLSWLRAVERPVSVKSLGRALPGFATEQIGAWLDAGHGAPICQISGVLEAVLTAMPRHEVPALMLADAVLARRLGWDHVVPLLAAGLKRADLRKRGDDLRSARHRAVVISTIEAVRLAADLARRADHLKSVAPKLRAKGSGAAVEMFLMRDAVPSSALPMPDWAARRLCDRLVSLGAVRELTGRETFRLYGL